MRLRVLRIGLRGMLVAVAVMTLATAAIVHGLGIPEHRARCLASARLFRDYEARVLGHVGRYETCAASHDDVDQRSSSCRTCGAMWSMMTLNRRHLVRSPSEAALELREVAELFARIARRFERGAYTPWLAPPTVLPIEQEAMRALYTGGGPISEHFFTLY